MNELAILASTKNYNAGNREIETKIHSIYQLLKNQKNLSPTESKKLLDEALKLKNGPQPMTLYCFPYAGGSSAFFESWKPLFSSEVKIVPIEYSGRGKKSNLPLIKTLPEMLDAIETELLPQLRAPFAFFGHSLGAVLAFEIAQSLSRKKISPQALFLSGCPAPDRIQTIASIQNEDDSSFAAILKELGGTPPELFESTLFRDTFLPILRADFSLLDGYHKEIAPLDIPLIVFGGSKDNKVSFNDLNAWEKWSSNSCSVSILEGDHFFLRNSKLIIQKIEATACPS